MSPQILHVTENLHYSFGGPPRSVPYLAKHLHDIGVQNHLFSIRLFEKESNEIIDRFRIPWTSAPFRFSRKLRYAPGLRRSIVDELRSDSSQLLHSHNMWNYAPYLVFKLHKEFRIPYVMSVRGTLFDWSLNQSKLKKVVAMKVFQREMLNKASLIHATSQSELQAIRTLGISTPVAVVPNGVSIDEFNIESSRSDACSSLGLDPDRRYMLFLSRIDKKKGLEFLIEAWSALSNKFQGWHLIIVGPLDSSTYSQKIRTVIQSAVNGGFATFLGPLDGARRRAAFCAAELFVLPTHSENFGIVIAEALASGVPVITTKGAPWAELTEYRAGWWIDSPIHVKLGLQTALSLSIDSLAEMGGNGRRLVKANYDWNAIALQMKAAYNWALGDRQQRLPYIY